MAVRVCGHRPSIRLGVGRGERSRNLVKRTGGGHFFSKKNEILMKNFFFESDCDCLTVIMQQISWAAR